jgi:hypothetical protein
LIVFTKFGAKVVATERNDSLLPMIESDYDDKDDDYDEDDEDNNNKNKTSDARSCEMGHQQPQMTHFLNPTF